MSEIERLRKYYAEYDRRGLPDDREPVQVDHAYRAILHLLRRCAESPEFRYHMLHTESLERLLLAWDQVRKEGNFSADEAFEGICKAKLRRASCSKRCECESEP